ncbi:MAG: DUF4159 domain-containing protein [Vicinamibacterales bacterium]
MATGTDTGRVPGRVRAPRRLLTASGLALVALVALASAASAQFGGRGFSPARIATDQDYDGRFHYCRVVYRTSFDGFGGNWTTDYPRADINLSIRLGELTRTDVSMGGGEPNHQLVRLSGPELYRCPLVIMSAPGRALLDEGDARALRAYLEKGGLLWTDDFWGEYQWAHWEAQLRKALPAGEFPIVDVPLDHPLFRTQFEVSEIPQIPNIGFFTRTGGRTSEMGVESETPRVRGILDASGRLMVVMTHNTDIADSWEREADDPTYFLTFGPKGYAFGINTVLYSLTH